MDYTDLTDPVKMNQLTIQKPNIHLQAPQPKPSKKDQKKALKKASIQDPKLNTKPSKTIPEHFTSSKPQFSSTSKTLSKRALRDIAKVTPFKPGKFVNLTPEGARIMGSEHVVEQNINDPLEKQTDMKNLIDEVQKIKNRKVKLINRMKENDTEIMNTNLRCDYMRNKIIEMDKQREKFKKELVESVR